MCAPHEIGANNVGSPATKASEVHEFGRTERRGPRRRLSAAAAAADIDRDK